MSMSADLADPHRHLFLDDEEIDSLVGVTRLINQLRRDSLEPVLRPDQPWEMGQVVPRRVIYDPADGLYKCWYLAATTNEPSPYRYGIGYATSPDGITWEKPALDVLRHEDGSPTNIVDLPRGTSARLLFPYLDMPGAAPEERFVGTLYQGGRPAAAGHLPGGLPGRHPLDGQRGAGGSRRGPLRHRLRPGAPTVDADHPAGQRRRRAPTARGVPLGERRFPDVVLPGPPVASRRARPPQHRVLQHAAAALRSRHHRLSGGLLPGGGAHGYAARLEPRWLPLAARGTPRSHPRAWRRR